MSKRIQNFRHIESLEARRLLSAAAMSALMGDYGHTPLTFEQNRGQIDARADFLARGNGYSLFLGDGGNATLSLQAGSAADAGDAQSIVLGMRLVGARAKVSPTGANVFPGKVNSFVGDQSQWRTNIPTFRDVMYDEVYRGIDLIYYGSTQRQLEYDFVAAPGSNPAEIRLAFDGVNGLQLDANGDLILHAGDSSVSLAAPVSYQNVNGHRVAVNSEFVLRAGSEVGFKLGTYDATQPLVIDPVLSYSTYVGGTGYDSANDIAVDAAGHAYITGQTGTTNFPTTVGAFQTGLNAANNAAFVTKLSVDGTAVEYSTYLGGGLFSHTVGHGIAVDAEGNAYVTGETAATDFPTTPGAFTTPAYDYDVFVTKLNPSGSALVYSSTFGGEFQDWARDIAVDSNGNAYVTGHTYNLGGGARLFPVTANAFQTQHAGGQVDAFVTKLNASGSALVYSSFLGGSPISTRPGFDFGEGIAVDASGAAYVTGDTRSQNFPTTPNAFDRQLDGAQDAFLTKVQPDGSSLAWSTFLGGAYSDIGGRDYGRAVAVDGSGHAYVTGFTDSFDLDYTSFYEGFPTTPNAFQPNAAGDASGATGGMFEDAFVTKFSSNGSSLVYSTYLGGYHVEGQGDTGYDQGHGIAIDSAGYAYVTGLTKSTNFPVHNTLPGQAGYRGWDDAFLTKLSPDGSALAFSTYLGTTEFDQASGVALDGAGNIYIAGTTSSYDFPTTPGAFQPANAGGTEHFDEAFITKIADSSVATVGLKGLSLAATTVPAGTQAQGTITLSAPAPAGGIVVSLKSARTDVATVPPTVTIPAGASSATFSTLTTTLPPGWNFSAGTILTATLNGGTRNVTLTVTPAPFNAIDGQFDLNGSSGPVVRLTFNLSVDASSLASGDLRVTDPAGQPTGISASSVSYDALTRTVTWGFTGALPNGQYRAILPAGSVTSLNNEPTHVAYTLAFFFMQGDADHNGVIDFDDYAHIDNGFNNGLTGFSNGDFNYDGVVNFDDYSLIDLAFNSQA